jgi:hypothetical protein
MQIKGYVDAVGVVKMVEQSVNELLRGLSQGKLVLGWVSV